MFLLHKIIPTEHNLASFSHLKCGLHSQAKIHTCVCLRPGVDKSLLCLVARMTFRATGLIIIYRGKNRQILVAHSEKIVAPGIWAWNLASP